MRLVFYGVSQIERPIIKSWAEAHHTTVDCVAGELTRDNIDATIGADGICFFPSAAMQADGAWFYQRLADNGLTHLAVKSTGVDGVDFNLAARFGLTVSNVPRYSPTSVGHFAVMGILMGLRQLPQTIADPRLPRRVALGRELADGTVGIVGTGRIGSVVAEAILALGGHVIAYSHHVNPTLAGRVQYVDWGQMLRQADVLSLHVPLSVETAHCLDAPAIAQMRPGAVIVNTARGGLIDTPALIAALKAGQLGGAVLDTIEQENQYFATDQTANPFYQQLTACQNVFITPHIAYFTARSVTEITTTVLQNAYDMAAKQGCRNLVDQKG